MKFLNIYVICIFLFSCSAQEQTTDRAINNIRVESQEINEDKKVLLSKNQLKDKLEKKDKQRSIIINGNKHFVNSLPLLRGAKIFNPMIQQFGIVTNQIYVIKKKNIEASLIKLPQNANLVLVTGRTYVIDLKDNKGDLLSFYDELIKLKQFDKVELQIDYSIITGSPIQ